MPAVNLRFEDLRARDNQKIDRDFFNKRYRLIAEAIAAISDDIEGVSKDSDNLVSLGLVRVNEVLGPLLAKVTAASEEGFLVAESATSVQLSVGLQTTLELTAGWQRDLFQPTPYVMLSRQGGGVDDWALFKVDTYDRDNGGLAGEVVAASGAIDAAAHADWVVSATAGIAKAVMEQAAAAQVAIDAAQAAAAVAEQAAANAEAVLDSGPVSSVNGQTGTVALGIGDIPNLTTTLGGKAASSHGHEIAEIGGLQAALNAAAESGNGENVIFKSASYTAVDRDTIITDSRAGGFTVTLPDNPAAGATVVVADGHESWGTNPVLVLRNGQTIQGTADDLNCTINGAAVKLRFTGSTWRVYVATGIFEGTALSADGAAALTNKSLDLSQNVVTGTLAQFNAALSDANFVTAGSADMLTNKTMDLTQNTVTVDGTEPVGFLNLPFVAEQTGTFSFDPTHKSKCVPINTGAVPTIPDAVFSQGSLFSIYNRDSTAITISCGITNAWLNGEDVATFDIAAKGTVTVLFYSGTECVIQGATA